MTISVPLTSRARKQAVVIQCVTRTSRVCRGHRVRIREVVSVGWYRIGHPGILSLPVAAARVAETNWRKPIVDGLRQLPASERCP